MKKEHEGTSSFGDIREEIATHGDGESLRHKQGGKHSRKDEKDSRGWGEDSKAAEGEKSGGVQSPN